MPVIQKERQNQHGLIERSDQDIYKLAETTKKRTVLTFRTGNRTYYLAYKVPLHVLTQFDLSSAQEAVSNCGFWQAPRKKQACK